MTTCPTCPHLQAENQRLLIEVSILRRIIAAARGECVALATEAEQKQRGHVPTGVWAYAQAQRDTAQKVLDRLSE